MKILNESDVLLVNVPTSRAAKINKVSASVLSMPPLGLMYIASYLIKKHYIVSFIDLAVESMTMEYFTKELEIINPKIVGISTYFESWTAMKSLIKVIKDHNKDIVIVGGGICANFCENRMLNELGFDFLSLGEGEYSFEALCSAILNNGSIYNVEGISFLNDNGDVLKKDVVRITKLDALPFPDRSILNLDKYVYPFTISTARGCPGRCVFCSSHAFWGEKVYFRKVENIIEEIRELNSQYNAVEFFVVDDTFTINPERTKKFCNLLTKLDTKFIWGCESRADVVDIDLLRSMYDAGCRKIQFGLESADDDILESINKKIKFNHVENAVRLASEIGFDINVSVIIGHANDTKKTIEYTIEKSYMLRDKYKANVLYSINTPFPGTDLYENAREMGIEILTDNFDFYSTDNAIINTRYLFAEDLRLYYNNIIFNRVGSENHR